MFSLYLVDPCAAYPHYDHQVWYFLNWQGTSMPMGRRLGEWIYVGKINEIKK
jgi:hypothetical protein